MDYLCAVTFKISPLNKLKDFHILIAEDDSDDAEVIFESFQKHPLFTKIDIVSNGKELLDYLENSETENPDIILTDLNMPIVNGLEALKQICSNQNFRQITTFAYSTSSSAIYQMKCIEFGAKSFLSKPSDINEYDEIPQKIIEVLMKNRNI